MHRSKPIYSFKKLLNRKIGYWTYNKVNDQFYWSKKACHMLIWPLNERYATLQNFLNLLHPNDHIALIEQLHKPLGHCTKNYKHQIRIKVFNNPNEYTWYELIMNTNKHMAFGFIINIEHRKNFTAETQKFQQQLSKFNAELGLTGTILLAMHNIHNIMHSISASISILEHKLSKNNHENFFKLLNLLKTNRTNLQNFLISDPKGIKIPEYIIMLGEEIYQEHQRFIEEIYHIKDQTEKIQQIIDSQKNISNLSVSKEKFKIKELIEAIKLFKLDK